MTSSWFDWPARLIGWRSTLPSLTLASLRAKPSFVLAIGAPELAQSLPLATPQAYSVCCADGEQMSSFCGELVRLIVEQETVSHRKQAPLVVVAASPSRFLRKILKRWLDQRAQFDASVLLCTPELGPLPDTSLDWLIVGQQASDATLEELRRAHLSEQFADLPLLKSELSKCNCLALDVRQRQLYQL